MPRARRGLLGAVVLRTTPRHVAARHHRSAPRADHVVRAQPRCGSRSGPVTTGSTSADRRGLPAGVQERLPGWSAMSARRLAGLGVAAVAASIDLVRLATPRCAVGVAGLDDPHGQPVRAAGERLGLRHGDAAARRWFGRDLAALVRARLIGVASALRRRWCCGLSGWSAWCGSRSTTGRWGRRRAATSTGWRAWWRFSACLRRRCWLAFRGCGVPRPRVPAGVVTLAGLVSLLCFTPILWAVLAEPWTGVRWWRAIPLGGVERCSAWPRWGTVLLLSWWASRAARLPQPTDG